MLTQLIIINYTARAYPNPHKNITIIYGPDDRETFRQLVGNMLAAPYCPTHNESPPRG